MEWISKSDSVILLNFGYRKSQTLKATTKCPTGKRLYATEQLAEDALIEAHINFEYPTGGGPVTVYHCEDCGCYHLTSKGTTNARLTQLINNGEIRKKKLAGQWERRMKK